MVCLAYNCCGIVQATCITEPRVEKPHFWSELILDHLFFITVADNLQRLPLIPTIARMIFPFLGSTRNKHTGYTRDQVAT